MYIYRFLKCKKTVFEIISDKMFHLLNPVMTRQTAMELKMVMYIIKVSIWHEDKSCHEKKQKKVTILCKYVERFFSWKKEIAIKITPGFSKYYIVNKEKKKNVYLDFALARRPSCVSRRCLLNKITSIKSTLIRLCFDKIQKPVIGN